MLSSVAAFNGKSCQAWRAKTHTAWKEELGCKVACRCRRGEADSKDGFRWERGSPVLQGLWAELHLFLFSSLLSKSPKKAQLRCTCTPSTCTQPSCPCSARAGCRRSPSTRHSVSVHVLLKSSASFIHTQPCANKPWSHTCIFMCDCLIPYP